MRRPVAFAPIALAALLLTGCTTSFIGTDGGTAGPQPTASPSPTGEPTPTPTPEPDYDCDDILINRPGSYVLGDCGTVTVEGADVELTAASIADLIIRGDDNDLIVDVLGDLDLSGQDNEIVATVARHIIISGDGNLVVVEQEIATVNVNGNENEVRSGLGIGSISDNGLLNEIG